jgi:hypothetical protein
MWLTVDQDGKPSTIPLDSIDKILIAAHNVKMVEFVKSEEAFRRQSG